MPSVLVFSTPLAPADIRTQLNAQGVEAIQSDTYYATILSLGIALGIVPNGTATLALQDWNTLISLLTTFASFPVQ